jgi:hypothetical protein
MQTERAMLVATRRKMPTRREVPYCETTRHCETDLSRVPVSPQHERTQQDTHCVSKRVADVIEWLNAIEPSVTKHFANNALQSNDNKIQWARDGCVLKATNFHGFLRVNKWCRDAPAVKSNRCGPDLSMGFNFNDQAAKPGIVEPADARILTRHV